MLCSEICLKISSLIRSGIRSEIRLEICLEIGSELRFEIRSKIRSAIRSKIRLEILPTKYFTKKRAQRTTIGNMVFDHTLSTTPLTLTRVLLFRWFLHFYGLVIIQNLSVRKKLLENTFEAKAKSSQAKPEGPFRVPEKASRYTGHFSSF